MKRIYYCLFTILLCLSGHIQTIAQSQPDSTLIEKYLLDFVVPDMPAFKALGTDASNILRPSDVKKFAAMLTPFYSNRAGVIPKNFAVEFAPWKLASKKWTLNDYNTDPGKRFLYRSSFSIGTINDTTRFPAKLAIGYRVSFLSKRADIYRAPEVKHEIFNQEGKLKVSGSMTSVQIALNKLTDYWVNNKVMPSPPIVERPKYYINHRSDFNKFLISIDDSTLNAEPALKTVYDNFIKEYRGPDKTISEKEIKDLVQSFGKRIDEYIEEYKKNNWNASRFDLALAWAAQSPDTLIANAQFSLFSAWATWALRIHKGGQLLIGGNLTLPRTEKVLSTSESSQTTNVRYNLNLRYYLGTQDVRGFLEGQYKYKNFVTANESLLINLGAEFKLGSTFWVVASAGLDNYLNEPKPLNKFVSSLDLRYFFNKPR